MAVFPANFHIWVRSLPFVAVGKALYVGRTDGQYSEPMLEKLQKKEIVFHFLAKF
jgi:hypothetical protein